MTVNSETILAEQTHPGDSVITTVTSDNFKGDGYYGRSDGLHSVQYTFTDFTGDIYIDGTLALSPSEEDWFQIHQYTASAETSSKITNFTGNYVYIRATVVYTDGTINSIVLNH